jgi:hypothetical protein
VRAPRLRSRRARSDAPSAGVSSSLCENEPTCVAEQALVDDLFSLVRSELSQRRCTHRPRLTLVLAPAPRSDFCTLPPGARARLVDSLCSNLSVLGSSCGMLDAAVDGAALGTHRSALKAYAFFLTHIVLASEAEAREAAPVAAAKVRQP